MITIIDQYFPEFNEHTFHPLQSWQWGEARKKMGIDVLRIGEFNQEKLINVFQLTIHQLPLTDSKIGYLPRSKFPSTEVLEFLFDYGKKNKIIFIKIEPYVKNSINNVTMKQCSNDEQLRLSPLLKYPLVLLANTFPAELLFNPSPRSLSKRPAFGGILD